MIELRQLRYLIAAVEAGSFSRAARNLNIKQPTLSRHILEIEKRLGMALFDRKTRGATLTANGATYLRVARRIMKEWDELDAWVGATTNGHAGKLAVGFYTSFSAGNLRATLSEFNGRFPEVRVRAFERDRDMLLAGVESGLLDIAIMIGEAPYGGLMTRPLWSERILVAMPERHPLAERERIHWTDLTPERFLPDQARSRPGNAQHAFGQAREPPRPGHYRIVPNAQGDGRTWLMAPDFEPVAPFVKPISDQQPSLLAGTVIEGSRVVDAVRKGRGKARWPRAVDI